MELARTRCMSIFIILFATSVADAGASFAPASSDVYAGAPFQTRSAKNSGRRDFFAHRGQDRQMTFAELSHVKFPDISFPLTLQPALGEKHYDEDLWVDQWLENGLGESSNTFLNGDNGIVGAATDAYEARDTGTLSLPASPIPESTSLVSLLVGIGILAREIWRKHRNSPDASS